MNDDIHLSAIYSAASGRGEWPAVLEGIAETFGLWTAQVLGVDKRRGHLIFSTHGGSATPQTALDYFRTYNAIDPRVPLALATPVGQWLHCHEHFDDQYVHNSPFYQDFLIPHGGRYVSGTTLIDNDDVGFILAFMRGNGSHPISGEDLNRLDRLRHHFAEAMQIVLHLRKTYAELGMARELLDQFDYPMLLVDETRGIWHRNESASDVLAAGDLVSEQRGFLVCHNRESDHALTEVIYSLALMDMAAESPRRRRAVSLRKADGSSCLAFISPVRPHQTMGAFGHTSLALVVLHDQQRASRQLDPFIVAECFDLTPAEARVAVQIAAGLNAKAIAREQGVSEPTIRTHISHVFEKTGVARQGDLIRLLLALPGKI